MKIIDSFKNIHTRDGTGILNDIPKSGFRRMFYIIQIHYIKLIALNVLLVLFSIPIVTIPAANIALNRCIFDLYSFNSVDPFTDFLHAFKQAFKHSLLYILLMLGFALIIIVFLYLLFMPSSLAAFSSISFILAIIVALYLWNVMCYGFAMDAFIDLKPSSIIKNSGILAFVKLKSNFLLIIAPGLFYFIIGLFLPYFIGILFLFGFSFTALFIFTVVFEPIKHHVVEPYATAQKNKTNSFLQ